eukprot:scaffold31183_cov73-Skeletonema_marinoi.AAC.1
MIYSQSRSKRRRCSEKEGEQAEAMILPVAVGVWAVVAVLCSAVPDSGRGVDPKSARARQIRPNITRNTQFSTDPLDYHWDHWDQLDPFWDHLSI